MGTFLALSGVIGKPQTVVVNSLLNFTKSAGGNLEKDDLINGQDNCCVIQEAGNNTSILYPDGFVEWDEASAFLSKDLAVPVFSFHVHDGDLWMYILYVNGEIVDQFNPIPDYWDESIPVEEIETWKGDATIVAKYIPGLNPKNIERYLTRWDLESEENNKAYPGDEFTRDWQLIDFMKKTGLSYPADEDNNATGETYRLSTKKLPIRQATKNPSAKALAISKEKPWWKFW